MLREAYTTASRRYPEQSKILIDEYAVIVDFDGAIVRLIEELSSSATPGVSIDCLSPGLRESVNLVLETGEPLEFKQMTDSGTLFDAVVEPVRRLGRVIGVIVLIDKENSSNISLAQSANMELKQQGDQIILETLEKTGGNISKAARILGINRTTIYRRIKNS